MKKLLTEPLFHFLVLGALIFAAYGWLNRDLSSPDEIVVTRAQQEHLVNLFARTWQRPPTPQEFQGLVRDFIREEIAYREGVAMGFDEGDTIIRRRMRQKLELLADEIVALGDPGEAELQQFLEDNPELFRLDPVFDLRQIYLSRERRGAAAEADALALLDRLKNHPEADWTAMGDPIALGDQFKDIRAGDLERQFGSQFLENVLVIEPGEWAGPVESGYGLHLVFIDDLVPARNPRLEEVRARVRSEWLAQRQKAAIDELYDRLSEKYSIEIESLVESVES